MLTGKAPAGTVIEQDSVIAVGTGDGLLALDEVQLAGKKRVPVAEFVNGYPAFVGSQLKATAD